MKGGNYREERLEPATTRYQCEGIGGEMGPATKRTTTSSNDGASIEVSRRPRGRPPGSKNRPNPPDVHHRVASPTEPTFRPHILQVPGGLDVVDAVSRFARRANIGLCILNGTGTVTNVSLRHPTTASSTVSFHGRFEILSISATFLPPSSSTISSSSISNGFTVSLVGPQGQIIGGSVAGSLLAAGTVVIVAAGFVNPSFHRLPSREEDEFPSSGVSFSGQETSTHHHQHLLHQHHHLKREEEEDPEEEEEQHQHHQHHQGVHHDHPHLMDSSSNGMSIFNSCHLPSSDVIWAPIARPPPPF